VDWTERRRLAARARSIDMAAAWREHADSGLPKLVLTRRALHLRRRHPELFDQRGAYTPLRVRGARAEHVVAFARGAPPGAVTVVPRLPLRLGGDWQDTAVELPGGEWHDWLNPRTLQGGEVQLAELLAAAPVALLARAPWSDEPPP
jgi:(1->4)-alpha-D-glucan 1-alpha-D-glucosylmutase